MNKVVLFFLLSLALTRASANGEMSGKVFNVIDGNTMEVLGTDNVVYKIILAGVDCPELTQEFGEEAKKCTEKMLLKKEVTVRFQGKDRKGNYIAVILKDGVDPRIELLKEGLAWTAEKDPAPELESYCKIAKEKGKGLWKEENPTPPWEYRRNQSMMQPKSS